MRSALFTIYLIVTSSLLLFSIFEVFPDLLRIVNLQKIPYYYIKADFEDDPVLVFTPRPGQRIVEIDDFRGDMYSNALGSDVLGIKYHASYNRSSFRTNSSSSPFDVAVIGDSFIEIGESDKVTFSEILKQTSGLSTLNLGRGWYGPQQYLELLKRHAVTEKVKYVIFSFFDGNDIEDTKQYLKWQNGEDYYHFASKRKNFFLRYLIVLQQIYSALKTSAVDRLRTVKGIHPELAMIQLDDRIVPMRFAYWNVDTPSHRLLRTQEWETLAKVLADFKKVAVDHGIRPVIVFIPTKLQVYGSFFTNGSGEQFLKKIGRQLEVETNSLEALQRIGEDLDIQLINLLPVFKKLAKEGQLLYYPFDTHWNIAGRHAASKCVTESLIRSAMSDASLNLFSHKSLCIRS